MWIGLRNGKGKLTMRGKDRLREREDLERLAWGRWWSSVWLSLESTCCYEECVWELVLLWGVRCCEKAQTVLCEEWKWFEVKIWTKMILHVFWVILQSKGKSISVDWIYWFNQTLKFYRKAFPEVIWSQNKHSLSIKMNSF